MRSILIIVIAIFFLNGCGAPKIMSQKSPLLDIDKSKCFIFPSKEYLLSKPISEQKIYSVTEKVLKDKSYTIYYDENNNCKNHLATNYVKTSFERMETTKGTSFTNTYGNINTNMYQYGYVPVQTNSYTFTTPDTTQKVRKYIGTYYLVVGVINNDKLSTVWSGKQEGEVSDGEVNITDSDYAPINIMVTRMIEETMINQK